jgi:hypothetical protein
MVVFSHSVKMLKDNCTLIFTLNGNDSLYFKWGGSKFLFSKVLGAMQAIHSWGISLLIYIVILHCMTLSIGHNSPGEISIV